MRLQSFVLTALLLVAAGIPCALGSEGEQRIEKTLAVSFARFGKNYQVKATQIGRVPNTALDVYRLAVTENQKPVTTFEVIQIGDYIIPKQTQLISLKTGKDVLQEYFKKLDRITLTPDAFHVISGNHASAKHRLVVFTDWQCPGCKRFHLEVIPKLTDQSLAIYRYDYPLMSIHPLSKSIALAGIAWKKAKDSPPPDDLLYIRNAKELSNWLDRHFPGEQRERFKKLMESESVQTILEQDIALAKQHNVKATPTIYLDGYQVSPTITDITETLEAIEKGTL